MAAYTRIFRLFYLYDDFGKQILMIGDCLQEMWTFSIFFVFAVLLFAEMFNVLGATYDSGTFAADASLDHNFTDYPLLRQSALIAFQSFRNSIGDLKAPHYLYWEKLFYEGKKPQAQAMIYTIWAFWILQIYVMVVIMLNFLIAIVSNSYTLSM